MKFEVEVNITEKQLLKEFEYWSEEAIQEFMFKIMPKIIYRPNYVDPRFTLLFAAHVLQRTIKAAKCERGDNAKEMNAKLEEMIEQLNQMYRDYFEL